MGGTPSGNSAGRRLVVAGMALVFTVGVVACSTGGSDTSAQLGQIPEPTLVGGMRTVPTVPSSDLASATGAGPSGEDSAAGGAAAGADPAVPPSTAYVGDVQPDPDGGDLYPAPPPNPALTTDGCARIADFDAAGIVGTAAGGRATTESIRDGACRITSGPIVAEVHFVPEATVLNDWFRREGIEPVGDVGSDAVGLGEFLAPGSDGAAGYTIAMVSAREGVVVAVRGAAVPRDVAADLAVMAAQAA